MTSRTVPSWSRYIESMAISSSRSLTLRPLGEKAAPQPVGDPAQPEVQAGRLEVGPGYGIAGAGDGLPG